MDRDGRVLMIVRATSPRNGNSNGAGNGGGGGAANGSDMLGLNMAAMEADWRQQQFQRQRMQLLSMAIFLCFMVLFFDNRAGTDPQQRRSRMENGMGTNGAGAGTNGYNRYAMPHEVFNDTARQIKVHELEHVLAAQPGYDAATPPMNVSGIYSGTSQTRLTDYWRVHTERLTSMRAVYTGTWESLAPEDYDAHKPVYTDVMYVHWSHLMRTLPTHLMDSLIFYLIYHKVRT